MDVMLKLAGELGEQMAAQTATKRFVASQEALNSDSVAQKLIDEYEKCVKKLAQLEQEGSTIEVADKHMLTTLQTDISANPTVKEFLASQVEYLNMQQQVNQAVMKQLTKVAGVKKE